MSSTGSGIGSEVETERELATDFTLPGVPTLELNLELNRLIRFGVPVREDVRLEIRLLRLDKTR